MTFAGLSNGKQRADVIAYLNTLSANPLPLPTAQGAATPAANAPAAAPAPTPAAAAPATSQLLLQRTLGRHRAGAALAALFARKALSSPCREGM